MLWIATRSPQLDPPGLGIPWDQAVRMGPVQVRFMMLDKSGITEMERRCRMIRLEQAGLSRENIKLRVKADVKKYMADLRERFTGSRAEPKKAKPKYRERNRGGTRGTRTRRSRATT